MTVIDLGNIRLNWRGVYDPKAPYVRDDAVSYKGSSFIALQQVTGVTPTVSPHWDILAAGTDQLKEEGDLLIHDGNIPSRLPRGTNAQILQMKGTCPTWETQGLDPSRRVWKLAKVNGLGGFHTRAYLMMDGTIRACGKGEHYANGNPLGLHTHKPFRITPENPESLASAGRDPVRFCDVFLSGTHSYALTAEGDVWSWGHNDYGQLGHGDTINRALAKRIDFFVEKNIKIVRIIPPRNNWHDQCCGYFLTTEGHLYACGINNYGNLGDGTTTQRSLPVRCGTLTNIVEVSVSGWPHSVYAIDQTGSLWVWGCNSWGQLGIEKKERYESPVQHHTLKNVKKAIVSTGHNVDGKDPAAYGVALLKEGGILTTGWNGEGQLGVGDTNERQTFTPLKLPDTSLTFVDVFCGDGRHGSGGAITDKRELWLWGYNFYGQLGSGNTEKQLTPFKPNAPFQGSVTLSVFGGGSSFEGCVVQAGNALWAAGYSETGCLGIGKLEKTNSKFQRILGQSGVIEEWGVYGKGTNQWGICVLYTDGRVDACGENSIYGETGTEIFCLKHCSSPLNNVPVLSAVSF